MAAEKRHNCRCGLFLTICYCLSYCPNNDLHHLTRSPQRRNRSKKAQILRRKKRINAPSTVKFIKILLKEHTLLCKLREINETHFSSALISSIILRTRIELIYVNYLVILYSRMVAAAGFVNSSPK